MKPAAAVRRFASRGSPDTRVIRRGRLTAPRLAYYAVRDGLGSTWVAGVAPLTDGGCRAEPAGGAAGARVASRRNDRVVARRADAGDWRDSGTRAVLQRQPAARSIRSAGALRPRPRAISCGPCRRRGIGGRGWTSGRCRRSRPSPGGADARVRQRVEHVEAALLRLGQRLGAVGSAAR